MRKTFPRRTPKDEWTTIAVEALPLGSMCAYWDSRAVVPVGDLDFEVGRGYAFIHPVTKIADGQVLGQMYSGARDNPNQLVAGQVGYSDDPSSQRMQDLPKKVELYVAQVWHPIEVQVAIHAVISVYGHIPTTLNTEVVSMMERV